MSEKPALSRPVATKDNSLVWWVVIPVILGLVVPLVWILALTFVVLSYMIRTGREPRWFLWLLHISAFLMLLRALGFGHMVMVVQRIPPGFTSREQYVEQYKPFSYLGVRDFVIAETLVRERVRGLTRDGSAVIDFPDPFSGAPLRTIEEEGFRIWYSVGPDQVDDGLATRYEIKGDTFGPGDIFVYRDLLREDTATSPAAARR